MSERSLSPEEAEIVQLREQVGASRERERHLREVLNDAYNHLEELRHELALSNEPGLAADIRDTLERIHNVRTGPARIDTSEIPATSSEASGESSSQLEK